MNSYRVKAALSRSILANPDACFVMMMVLPFGSTRAFATAMRRLARPGYASPASLHPMGG